MRAARSGPGCPPSAAACHGNPDRIDAADPGSRRPAVYGMGYPGDDRTGCAEGGTCGPYRHYR